MFKFQREQRTFRVGDVEFGGQPGKRRAVLICPLEENRAWTDEALSAICQEIGASGVPFALLLCPVEVGLIHRLSGMVGIGAAPIVLDVGRDPKGLEGLAAARELGLSDRIVCRGLGATTPEGVWEGLHHEGGKAIMLGPWMSGDSTLRDRIYSLEGGTGSMEEGLVDKAKRYGANTILVDTGGSPTGVGLRTLFVAKAKWGLPCGCDLRPYEGLARGLEPSSTALAQAAGADFVYAGPSSTWAATARSVALADSLLAQAASEL